MDYVETKCMKIVTSRNWRHLILVISAAIVYLFVIWRMILNGLIPILVYISIHLYQLTGILIWYLIIEKDEYFSTEKVRCIETLFFCFIGTPYTSLMFILNTRDQVYGDPEDSPWCWMIGTVPIPWLVVAIVTPFIDTEKDFWFWICYILVMYLFAYCSYAVMENIMDMFKWKAFPYTNPVTWVSLPILVAVYWIGYCLNGEEIRRQASERRQRALDQIEQDRQRRQEADLVSDSNVIGDEDCKLLCLDHYSFCAHPSGYLEQRPDFKLHSFVYD